MARGEIGVGNQGMGDRGQSEVELLRARVAKLEHEAAEERNQRETFEKMLRGIPLFVIRVDQDRNIRFINHALEGYDPASVLGSSVYAHHPPEAVAAAKACYDRVFDTGIGEVLEVVGDTSPEHGSTSHYRSHVSALDASDGTRSIVITALDIAAEVRKDAALERSQEQLQIASQASGMGLWSWDFVSGEVLWNHRMFEILGTSEVLTAQAYREAIVEEDRALYDAAQLLVGQSGVLEPPAHRYIRPDGGLRWLLIFGRLVRDRDGKPCQCVGGTIDVTRQRETEDRLLQAEKMEAVGRLAAGIAHNFNNMLSVMLPTLDRLRRSQQTAGELKGVDEAYVAGWRASEMVQQLMSFARGGTDDSPHLGGGVGALDSIVRTAVLLARTTLGDEIEVVEEVEPIGHRLTRGASEVEQAIVNVMVNARDAIRSSGRSRGTIVVKLTAEDLGERIVAVLSVTDDGGGMSPDVARRVFEPFFTTKGANGTGLGLAMVDTVIRSLGGSVRCSSELNVGTTFTFRIPVTRKASRAANGNVRTGNGESVLVVDDETAFLRTLSGILQDGGYVSETAATSETALQLLRERRETSVVLLDRTMPGPASTEIVRSIRTERPDVRIVLFTGREVPADERLAVEAVLQKPASMEDILATVGRVLSMVPKRVA